MSPRPLLDRLRRLGIRIRLDGERLLLDAPDGSVPPELASELREHRSELVEFLQRANQLSKPSSTLIPLQAHGSRPPLFAAPGHNGDVFCFVPLSRRLGENQPFLAFQPPGLEEEEKPLDRVEELAARFVEGIRQADAGGQPLRLGGYCSGGVVAFEAACQLAADGVEVATLVLFGTPGPASYTRRHRWTTPPVRAVNRAIRFAREFGSRKNPIRELAPGSAQQSPSGSAPDERRVRVENATTAAVRAYSPRPFPGDVLHFIPSENPRAHYCEQYDDWRNYVKGDLRVVAGPPDCIHSRMLREPYVEAVARELTTVL